MPSLSLLSAKPLPVLDRDRVRVGTLTPAGDGPTDPSTIEIDLDDDVREGLDLDESTVRLPVRAVCSIRRDEVQLETSVRTLPSAFVG